LNKESGKKDPDIGPESTWEIGYIESFNGKPMDEFLEARGGF